MRTSLEIVQDSVIQDKHNVEVFRTKAVLPAGSSIKTIYGTEMSPSFDSWFFFVDDSPLQSWGHLCRYVFVNANDGRIKTFSKTCHRLLTIWKKFCGLQ